MNSYILQILSVCIVLFTSGCSSSPNQSVQPSTIFFDVKINGVNEQAITQQDTLQITSTRMIVENIKLGIDYGPPVVVMPGQAEVSYNDANAGESINIIKREIQGNLYRSAGFSVAPAEDLQVGNPEYSVITKGIFNGDNFDFETDLTFTRNINFAQSLEIPPQDFEGTITFVTDVQEWFINGEDAFINPMADNTEEDIEQNIKGSFDMEVETSIN